MVSQLFLKKIVRSAVVLKPGQFRVILLLVKLKGGVGMKMASHQEGGVGEGRKGTLMLGWSVMSLLSGEEQLQWGGGGRERAPPLDSWPLNRRWGQCKGREPG